MSDSDESGSTTTEEDFNQTEFALKEVIRNMEAMSSDDESDTDSESENYVMSNNAYHHFLRDFLKEDHFQTALMTYDVVKNAEVTPPPESLKYGTEIVHELLEDLNEGQAVDEEQAELFGLIISPHFRHIIESYESICCAHYNLPYLPAEENQIYEVSVDSPALDQADHPRIPIAITRRQPKDHFIGGSVNSSSYDLNSTMRSSAYQSLEAKQLDIDLKDCQNLGITVTRRETVTQGRPIVEVVVERVLADSPAEKSGITPGDIIQFVNDQPIENVDDVRQELKKSRGAVSLRLYPQKRQLLYDKDKLYVRCLTNYRPANDSLLPKGCMGVEYTAREVLEIMNKEDSNYWQARKLGNGRETGPVGLIPSDILEEKRKAFNPVDLNSDSSSKSHSSNKCISVLRRFSSKKKNKIIFSANNLSGICDRGDIKIYEEVTPLNPSRLTTLVLVGPSGVGKRSVKELLAARKPEKFTAVKREQLSSSGDVIRDVREGKFLEFKQIIHNNQIEGIRYASIDNIIKDRKTAVIDCLPKNLRGLYTAMYCPFVVFLSAPPEEVLIKMQEEGMQAGARRSMKSKEELNILVEESRNMENLYGSQADAFVLNSNPHQTVYDILHAVQRAEYSQRWVPITWQHDVRVRPVPTQISPPPSPPPEANNTQWNLPPAPPSYKSNTSSKVSSQFGEPDLPIVKAQYVKFSGQSHEGSIAGDSVVMSIHDSERSASIQRPSTAPRSSRQPVPSKATIAVRQLDDEESDTVTEDSSSDSPQDESSDEEVGNHHDATMGLKEVSV